MPFFIVLSALFKFGPARDALEVAYDKHLHPLGSKILLPGAGFHGWGWAQFDGCRAPFADCQAVNVPARLPSEARDGGAAAQDARHGRNPVARGVPLRLRFAVTALRRRMLRPWRPLAPVAPVAAVTSDSPGAHADVDHPRWQEREPPQWLAPMVAPGSAPGRCKEGLI